MPTPLLVYWNCYEYVWPILSLLDIAALVEHVEGMSMALRWFLGVVKTKYGCTKLASICSISGAC